MATTSQRPKEREGTVSLLDAAIEVTNLAKVVSSITPAKAASDSVGVLTMIKVCFFLIYDQMFFVHA